MLHHEHGKHGKYNQRYCGNYFTCPLFFYALPVVVVHVFSQ